MNYLKIDKCSMSDGLGVRTVLWVSGCRVNCYGCQNPQSWDFNAGIKYDEQAENELFEALAKPYVDGLTLSGGHPLEPENADAVLEIVKSVKKNFPNKNIWIYSGYTFEYIMGVDKLKEIMKYTDVLVDGEYIDKLRDVTLPFRGSSNQCIIEVQKELLK